MNGTENEQAIHAAQIAVTSNPSDFAAHVELGMAYFHADRLDEAMAAFERAITLNPDAAAAYNGIGRIRYHTGPPEAAIEAYERAISLDQHTIDPFYGLGILYSAQLGDYESALAAFQRGLEHNPDDPLLSASAGSTYARMGQIERALVSLQQTSALHPDNIFAHAWLSILYLHLRQVDAAILSCQREIALEDAHSPRRLLGYIFDWMGRDDEAIVQLERSIALDPTDYEARAALAKVYHKVGRLQEAGDQYAIAHEMAMQDDEYGQACFAAVSGDREQALALLKVGLAKGQVQPGWIRIDPEFAFMNDDPRFQALLDG
jgi:tetratricopeptide (TPR) repeat protein